MKYCPKCDSLDFNNESFYCSNCGTSLMDQPRDSNKINFTRNSDNKKSKSFVWFEILLMFCCYVAVLIYFIYLFGTNVLLFMFPIFIIIIGASAKILSYQLKPEEKSIANIAKRNRYDRYFEREDNRRL